ncbi:MAG TPA: ATP-binding cassette domain-containing protein [Acidimicrobiia bacterium]|nr:ATP-binding cassette domain-containing protein [Acidimicrobiia bacterium]
MPVVQRLDLEVQAGEVVALLGPNGAGKTTALMTLSGELPLISGEVIFNGESTRAPLHKRVRGGMAVVTEERSVFMGMSTVNNLRVGRVDTRRALERFPELNERLKVPAGLLSGGEQQMLTLARALAREPTLLLADELSLGLAPKVVERLLRSVRDAADQGLGVLLVEQHIPRALDVADRAYVMRRGQVVMQGSGAELRDRVEEIEAAYLT